MRAILEKLSFQRSIGVFLTEQELVLSLCASTIAGRRELFHVREPLNNRTPEEVLDQVLKKWAMPSGKARVPVAFGVPQRMIFHGAHPINNNNRNATAAAWLETLLKTPNVKVDEMLIDLNRTKIGNSPIAQIAACRRRNVEPFIEAIKAAGTRLTLVEPEACALARLGERVLPSPSRANLVARVFLGEGRGLVLLSHKKQPLIWKEFDWKAGELQTSLIAAVAFLKTNSRAWGFDLTVDTLMIHGRPELTSEPQATAIEEALAIRKIAYAATPVAGPDAIAKGLAYGCQEEIHEIDLDRNTKPPVWISEIFPWSEMIVQIILLAAVWFFMDGHLNTLAADQAALKNKIEGVGWLKNRKQGELDTEKKTLELRLKSISTFVDSRIPWLTHLNSLGSTMPRKIMLEQLHAQNDLNPNGAVVTTGGKITKMMVLRFNTELGEFGRIPVEVDELVQALRANTILTSEYPVIEMVDLKTAQGYQGAASMATFSVICTPKLKKIAVNTADH